MNISRTILIGIVFSMVLPSVSYAASQTFTSSGSFTVPAGVTSITATIIGGGGGGGGTEGRGDNRAGGGGGSGGYSVGTYTVTPGSVITVTVGRGGAPGTFAFNYNYTCNSWGTDPDTGSSVCLAYDITPSYMCSTAGSTGTRDGAAGTGSSISSVDGSVSVTGGGGGTGSGSTDPNWSSGGDNCGGLPGAGGTPGGVAGHPFSTSPDTGDSLNDCPRNNYTAHPGGVLPSTSSYGKGGDSNANPGSAICAAPGQAGRVILDWTVPSVGTVNVSSNISSSWTITGPTTITGSGTSQSSTSKPTGTYTITWGAVSGYTAPATQSLTLTSGGTITFTGTYVASSLPPEPTFNATCTLQGNGTYSVALTWNAVTPVTNYPLRLQGPSHATGNSGGYAIGRATRYTTDDTDVIGWGVVGDAPTASGLTFTGLTASGNYDYWGHAWSSTNGWSTNTVKTVICGTAAPSCTLPWGGTLASGSSVTAYQSASVTSPATCTSQTRTCTSGTLSGTYTNQSCSVTGTGASCTLPWGGTIADGASVTAYQSASVTSPATCTSQTRTCSNGSLSGTYSNQSCSVTGSGATGSVTGPNCTISAGASTCTTTETWSTSGVTLARVQQDGVSFSTALSGSSSRTVGYTASTFTLIDRSTGLTLDTDNTRGTCASGSGWNGSYCELGYLPDLTADNGVTPVTAQPGVSTTLTATIRNIGPLTTGSNFDTFIQIATATNGGGTITGLSSRSMNTLAAGASNTTSQSYTFPAAGTYSARACADKRNNSDSGKIDESNEGNNCGGWLDVVVAAPAAPSPTATLSASPTSINPGQTSRLTWSSTNATSCTFADTGAVGTSGNRNVTPSVTSTYSITCSGTGGTSAPATAIVTVLTPTLSISANPSRVVKGNQSTISWTASNVRSCTITRNGAAWKSGNANGSNIYTGSSADTINAQTLYVMSCRDVNGVAYGATASVLVNLAPDFQEF